MFQNNISICPAVNQHLNTPSVSWVGTTAVMSPVPALGEVRYTTTAQPSGTAPAGANNIVWGIQINGARGTDMKHTVCAVSGSIIMGGTGMPMLDICRFEGPELDENSVSSAQQSFWKSIPFNIAQHIGAGQTDGCIVAFEDAIVLDARPDNPANNVYFMLQVRNEVAPTSLAAHITLRANVKELVPFQPLKS